MPAQTLWTDMHRGVITLDSISTANGNALGTTVVDGTLVTRPSYQGQLLKLIDGNAAGQVRPIATHPAGTNTLTVADPFRDSAGAVVQVVAGTRYMILSLGQQQRGLYQMDFWSDPQEEVSIPAIAATLSLPSVTVADLPVGATIERAIAMVKFRAIENTNAAANKLNGATVAGTSQVIQVRDDTPGTWRDSINFVDDQFGLAGSTREGGDALVGSIDIAVEVDGNDTYEFRYLLARADMAALNWNDVQCGLRVYYSVP